MDFNLEFDTPKNFDLEFESSENDFNLDMGSPEIVPIPSESDHRLLTHRNDDDQHSIDSISGLKTTLDNKAETEDLDEKLEESDLDEIENQEILYLWNKLIK